MEPLQLLGGSNPQALVLCPRGSSLCLCHHLLLCRPCRADRTGALLPCPPWPSLGPQAFPWDWAVTSWLNVLPLPLGGDIDQPWSTPVQGGAPSLCLSSSPTVMGLLQYRVLTPLQSIPRPDFSVAPLLASSGPPSAAADTSWRCVSCTWAT